MKREFLKDLNLEDEVIEKIMSENGRDIEKYKKEVEKKKKSWKAKILNSKQLIIKLKT